MATGEAPAGYPTEMLDAGNDVNNEVYTCRLCKQLLMEPVQGSCGHRFCQLCINYVIKHGEKAAHCPECLEEDNKETSKLEHATVHPDKAIRREMYKLKVTCPDCQWKGSFKEMDQSHWKDCPQKPVWAKSKEEAIAITANPKPNKQKSADQHNKEWETRVDAQGYQIEEIIGVTIALGERLDQTDQGISNIARHLTKQKQQMDNLHEAVMTSCQPHDGIFLWRVDEYTKKKQQAIQGRCTKLFSPKFRTTRHGYTMRAVLYLNGEGRGEGTHMSIYLVMCQGDFDAFLPWPFAQKVIFQLVSWNGEPNLVDFFIPKPGMEAFRRPTSTENIPSGKPTFAPQEDVERQFLNNDTLYILIQVDTSGLIDPAQALKA